MIIIKYLQINHISALNKPLGVDMPENKTNQLNLSFLHVYLYTDILIYMCTYIHIIIKDHLNVFKRFKISLFLLI